MIKLSFSFTGVLFGALVLLLSGCTKQDLSTPADREVSQNKKEKDKTFYGPATPMGDGVSRAWVKVDVNGMPVAVGINMTVEAVESLGDAAANFKLQLPKQAGMTLYDHVDIGWNPQGHPPIGTYSVPHFDVHFYMITEEEQMAIQGMAPVGPGGLQFDAPVPPQFVPLIYVQDPGIIPMMGVHWADLNSPEFQGSSFTRTFILGSLGGNFIFHEPMVTLAYLEAQPNETIPIPQASQYQKSGYYPQSYSISYDKNPGQYTIAVTDLQYRMAP